MKHGKHIRNIFISKKYYIVLDMWKTKPSSDGGYIPTNEKVETLKSPKVGTPEEAIHILNEMMDKIRKECGVNASEQQLLFEKVSDTKYQFMTEDDEHIHYYNELFVAVTQ